jgi:hypothetical protein
LLLKEELDPDSFPGEGADDAVIGARDAVEADDEAAVAAGAEDGEARLLADPRIWRLLPRRLGVPARDEGRGGCSPNGLTMVVGRGRPLITVPAGGFFACDGGWLSAANVDPLGPPPGTLAPPDGVRECDGLTISGPVCFIIFFSGSSGGATVAGTGVVILETGIELAMALRSSEAEEPSAPPARGGAVALPSPIRFSRLD